MFLLKNSRNTKSFIKSRVLKTPSLLQNIAANRGIAYLYGFFAAMSLLLILSCDKRTLHKMLNEVNAPFFDFFFKYLTYAGDGFVFVLLTVAYIFIDKHVAKVYLFGGVLTLLITHFLKKIIFKGVLRPASNFGPDSLHYVKGVELAYFNSFPSGHAISAFAIATILSFKKKSNLPSLWFFLAIMVSISRVYLSQHYLIDVFVGSMIGIFIGFVSTLAFNKQ